MQTSVYEHPVWLSVPGQVMRPGGITITEQALSLCNMQPNAHILDLGCGAGATISHLTFTYGLKGFGIDISSELLLRGQQSNPQIGWTRAQGESLPIACESMDIILAECTLSIFDTVRALQECIRLLKPGGYLIVNDLYVRNENGVDALRKLPPGTCIRDAMSQEQIQQKIRVAGFELITWQDCSETLKEFPLCTLIHSAKVDPFDLQIATARAKLGYYFLIAQKLPKDR